MSPGKTEGSKRITFGEPNHEIANFGFAVVSGAPVARAAGASCIWREGATLWPSPATPLVVPPPEADRPTLTRRPRERDHSCLLALSLSGSLRRDEIRGLQPAWR